MIINSRMVALGWAVAYGDYELEEAEARQSKRGIWAGQFTKPSHWRKDEAQQHSAGWMSWFKF